MIISLIQNDLEFFLSLTVTGVRFVWRMRWMGLWFVVCRAAMYFIQNALTSGSVAVSFAPTVKNHLFNRAVTTKVTSIHATLSFLRRRTFIYPFFCSLVFYETKYGTGVNVYYLYITDCLFYPLYNPHINGMCNFPIRWNFYKCKMGYISTDSVLRNDFSICWILHKW